MLNLILTIIFVLVILEGTIQYIRVTNNTTRCEAVKKFTNNVKELYHYLMQVWTKYSFSKEVYLYNFNEEDIQAKLNELSIAKKVYFDIPYSTKSTHHINFKFIMLDEKFKNDLSALEEYLTVTIGEMFAFQFGGSRIPMFRLYAVSDKGFSLEMALTRYGDLEITNNIRTSAKVTNTPNMSCTRSPVINEVLAGKNKIQKGVYIGKDLDFKEEKDIDLNIMVDVVKNPHWLITGNSGTGKSYFTLMTLQELIRSLGDRLELYICDYKNSEEFDFLRGYEHYYAEDDCVRGIEEFYDTFHKVKSRELKSDKMRILVFDEFAGLILSLQGEKKKIGDRCQSMVQELLLLGRSAHCGVFSILQRPDANFIKGREQFFVSVAFGKLSTEHKKMIMQGDDLEQKPVYDKGEGIVKIDGKDTRFLKVPPIEDVDKLKEDILKGLHILE